MLDFFGKVLGMPFVLLGYGLAGIAEGLVRLGAWLAGYALDDDGDDDDTAGLGA